MRLMHINVVRFSPEILSEGQFSLNEDVCVYVFAQYIDFLCLALSWWF